MQKKILFALILGLYLTNWPGNAFSQNTAKTVSLFDGKTLKGWYTYIAKRGRNIDPKHVFSVENGLIHISGEEYGSIVSDEEYADYTLTLEFKWGEKTYAPRLDRARDSGLLIHSTGPDGGYRGIWMRSIECQLIEGGTGDLLVVGDGSDHYAVTSTIVPKNEKAHIFAKDGEPITIHSGRIDWFARDPDWKDEKGFRGQADIENPFGEWNTIVCVASGETVSIYLNGTLVNHATKVKPSKGRIQLQSEGAELFVRKVTLTSLK